MSATESERRAVVKTAAFTFDLDGICIYCEKKCKRQRTFHASSTEQATKQADAAMANLCHRKCGGY